MASLLNLFKNDQIINNDNTSQSKSNDINPDYNTLSLFML